MRASWISRVGVGSAAASLLFLSTAGLLGGTVAAAPPPPPDLLPAHASVVSPSVLAHSQKLHAVNPRQSWTVGLILPSKNPRGLETYAQEVSTPGSAVYRHFLSHQQMMAAYGPSATVVSTIETYLTQHGLKFRLVGQILDVTGSVAQINQLFASTLGQYKHGSQEFVAPVGAITIPDALRVAAGIDGLTTSTVAPLSNFRKASQATGLFHAMAAAQLGPRPTGLTSTVSSDGLTVSVQLLTPVQTVGLGTHYLVTGRLNGAPDQGLTLVQVGGQLKGGVPGFLTTVTNVNGQFELDFSLSQAQKTDLNIEVATVLPTTGAVVGPVITVPLPVATFKGAAANVCSSTLFGPTPKGQKPFPILCPWNPRSNSVNTAFNATALVSRSRMAGPASLAVFTAGNVFAPSVGDVNAFAHQFGLKTPAVSVAYVSPSACTNVTCPGVMPDIEAELSLDLQMMETSSPAAHIQIYASGSLRDALNAVVLLDSASVFSISYGEGELAEQQFSPGAQYTWDLLAWEANVEGITVTVASGDSGAFTGAQEGLTTPQPSYPANSGGVSAVGGLEASSSPSSTLNETAMWGGNLGSQVPRQTLLLWLEQENMMASGGYSTLEPAPPYQVGFIPHGAGRGTPDYSLPASVVTPGYFGYLTLFGVQGTYYIGGTSASAPLLAGYIADMDNLLGGGLGNVNYAIYPLARRDPSILVPVAFGDNGVYKVTNRYNAATGLGGLNIDQLAGYIDPGLSGAVRAHPGSGHH